MVAHNPLFHGRWTLKKFNATVVNDIWPEVLFFSAVATSKSASRSLLQSFFSSPVWRPVVYLVSTMTSTKLSINTGLLTVLGTVLGLVISFRTSTAYERYATPSENFWEDGPIMRALVGTRMEGRCGPTSTLHQETWHSL